MTQQNTCDVLIKNALVFDGSGNAPVTEDLAILNGKVLKRGVNLQFENVGEIVDATGKWLTPGLLDIHTHLDLEVEVNPGLGEAVRHGSTTVLLGNCSLGVAFGSQERNGESPIVDCFTRVENMPKQVLRQCIEKITWDNTADYMDHFSDLPLGPNVAAFVPNSMLRIEVMGTNDSISRPSTDAEKKQMQTIMSDCMKQGYMGLSTDQIVFHYMANDPNKNKRIPTHFAEDDELRPMLEVVRKKGGVWQTNPDGEKMVRTLKRFFWSCARFRGKPLKVSALTAVDFVSVPGIWKKMLKLGRVINSKLLGGKIHFQALGGRFRIFSDGMISPVFEELESTREIIACEVDQPEERLKLFNDPGWLARFDSDWKRMTATDVDLTKLGGNKDAATFQMDFEKMFFSDCAVPSWDGDSLATVMGRLAKFHASGGKEGAKDAAEAEEFAKFPPETDDQKEFWLQGMRLYDMGFRWWFDVANLDEDIVEEILFDPNALPGFNDSGAHLTNLSFYDGNLGTLRIAQKRGDMRVAHAVHRLTREAAEFFNLDAGSIEPGAQADIVLINPEELKKHDMNDSRKKIYHELFGQDVLVNRTDGVVEQVYIKGVRVWEDGSTFTPALGTQTLGRVLRANA
ncbi:MAG: amidohydrolase family protein [Porticoccaceae bacterium]|nr:amidohydrolase family protein [Porticoccaceae bacterium]